MLVNPKGVCLLIWVGFQYGSPRHRFLVRGTGNLDRRRSLLRTARSPPVREGSRSLRPVPGLDAAPPAVAIAAGQEFQLFEVFRCLQPPPCAEAQDAVQQVLALHVMGNEPGRPRRDMLCQGLKAGGHVVVAIDRLADVMHQGRQKELLVVRQFVAGQIEDLQTVIQGVAFGMVLPGFP